MGPKNLPLISSHKDLGVPVAHLSGRGDTALAWIIEMYFEGKEMKVEEVEKVGLWV